MRTSRTGGLLAGLMILCASVAWGQNYPSKPIRLATGSAGSGADFVTRLVAQGLTASLHQQVIVDNRPSGVILGEIVAKAPADGYTLLLTGSSFWLAPFLQDNVPWDPVRDFSPITLAVNSPNVVVVHPSVAAISIKELIALAKGKPGSLNYASGSAGSSAHLAGELFKAMAGVNIVRIPYRGAGPALNDLLGGQVQMMFPNAGTVAPHLKSGRLRGLAVTSAQPSVLAPNLPTVAAAGVPGYVAVSLNAVFAPSKTPKVVINRLNQEVVRLLKTDEVKERLINAGVEAAPSSVEELAATIKSDMATWGKLIKQAGIREE